jgi:hypothetical protein
MSSTHMTDKKFIQVTPLHTSQTALGGELACATISGYLACYLLYSVTPREESIREWMRLGCVDWRVANADRIRQMQFEQDDEKKQELISSMMESIEAIRKHPMIHASMQLDLDLEASGLMLTDPALLANLPSAMTRDAAFEILYGVEPAMTKLAEAVLKSPIPANAPLQHQPVYSFVFSRGLRNICGSVRRFGSGVRFDLIDSHECWFPSLTPELRQSCAIWVICNSVPEICRVLKCIYPLDSKAKAEDLDRLSGFRLPCQYSLTVFKRQYQTPEEAQKHYKRSQTQPYVSPVY